MKKLLGVILSLTLLVTGVSGCAANKKAHQAPDSGNAAANAVSVSYDSDDYYFDWKNSSYKTISLSGTRLQ